MYPKSPKTSWQRLEPETYWGGGGGGAYIKFHYWVVAGIKLLGRYEDVLSYCVAEKVRVGIGALIMCFRFSVRMPRDVFFCRQNACQMSLLQRKKLFILCYLLLFLLQT